MAVRSGTNSGVLVTEQSDLLDLEVGPVAHGGHCVARHDNRVVFVRHALPGERVRARVTEVRSRYLRADAVEILRPSPDRVTPSCPYAGPGQCGGCDFQHVTFEAQRRLKAQVVAEQLRRLARLPDVDVTVEELPGGPLGWRTRVRYAVDRQGRAGLRRHRSHEVVAIDRCRIAAPEIQAAPVTSRSWPGRRSIDVVRGADGAVTVVADGEVVSGPDQVAEQAAGRRWSLPPEAFWQVHPAAADTFVACVRDMLAPAAGERVWDLYGGAGLFAAALARDVGPEGHVTVVESARYAAPLPDLPQITVVRGRVERVLRRRGMRTADLVVLDPPRAGAGAEVVERVVAARPRAVAYVACDPAALARDIATFRSLGWRLARLRAFDAFPMTHHVECVALLTPVRS